MSDFLLYEKPPDIEWKRGDGTEKLLDAARRWRAGYSLRSIAAELNVAKGCMSGVMNHNRDLFPRRTNPVKREVGR